MSSQPETKEALQPQAITIVIEAPLEVRPNVPHIETFPDDNTHKWFCGGTHIDLTGGGEIIVPDRLKDGLTLKGSMWESVSNRPPRPSVMITMPRAAIDVEGEGLKEAQDLEISAYDSDEMRAHGKSAVTRLFFKAKTHDGEIQENTIEIEGQKGVEEIFTLAKQIKEKALIDEYFPSVTPLRIVADRKNTTWITFYAAGF